MFDKFRLTPAKYQRITYLSVLLLSLIIVTGAAVRLTGSGLGCSDWPTCEDDQLVAEIDDVHAMVEFVNRVIRIRAQPRQYFFSPATAAKNLGEQLKGWCKIYSR